MRRDNRKLNTVLIMGVSALLMLSSHRVLAEEVTVFKCKQQNGKISYQDSICSDQDKMDILNIKFNKSADTDVGLRPNEKVAYAAIQKQMARQQLLHEISSQPNQPAIIIKFEE